MSGVKGFFNPHSVMYTSGGYLPLTNTVPAPLPTVAAHLTAPLMKPLHTFSGDELLDLAHELEEDMWLDRERHIAAMTQRVFERWLGDMSHPFGPAPYTYPVEVPSQLFSRLNVNIQTNTFVFRIQVPASLPPEYARAFIERMIRDAMEEG